MAEATLEDPPRATEGRCPIVRGGSPPAAHFVRFTIEKAKSGVRADETVTGTDYDAAITTLEDPAATIVHAHDGGGVGATNVVVDESAAVALGPVTADA